MKLIVNTNRIIASLIKDSSSRRLLLEGNAEFLVINVSEMEIEKYRREILQKTHLTDEQYQLIYEKVMEKLSLLPDAIVNNKMGEARKVMDSIDKDDTPFIAAALATNAAIWSDDKHFQKQKKIKVWKTEELIKELE